MKLRRISNMMTQVQRITVADILAKDSKLYLDAANETDDEKIRDKYLLTAVTLQATANFLDPEHFPEPESHRPKKKKQGPRHWIEKRYAKDGTIYILQRWRENGVKRSRTIGKVPPPPF